MKFRQEQAVTTRNDRIAATAYVHTGVTTGIPVDGGSMLSSHLAETMADSVSTSSGSAMLSQDSSPASRAARPAFFLVRLHPRSGKLLGASTTGI